MAVDLYGLPADYAAIVEICERYGVVLIEEPGRALTHADVERSVRAPIVATVGWDTRVARAVDAGLLATRLPRPLHRALARVAA